MGAHPYFWKHPYIRSVFFYWPSPVSKADMKENAHMYHCYSPPSGWQTSHLVSGWFEKSAARPLNYVERQHSAILTTDRAEDAAPQGIINTHLRSIFETNKPKKKGRTHHESLKRSKDLILVYYLLKTNKHNSHVKNLLNKWDRPLYSHPFFWNFRRPNPPSPRHLHQGHWSLTLVMTRFFPWFFSSTKTTFKKKSSKNSMIFQQLIVWIRNLEIG